MTPLPLPLEVLDFISKFTKNGTNQGTIETFTLGCCYWFAFILKERFKDVTPAPEIMIDNEANHFATKIGKVIYDITGDVTNSYNWEHFSSITDEAYLVVLKRDCIDKLT